MTSTVVKCTTVGLMKACIAARLFSVKTLAPIEAATNMSPTSVAAAVPIKRSKSCQSSTSSESEEFMLTHTGASSCGITYYCGPTIAIIHLTCSLTAGASYWSSRRQRDLFQRNRRWTRCALGQCAVAQPSRKRAQVLAAPRRGTAGVAFQAGAVAQQREV